MYLSGFGVRPMEDGRWGDMKQQTVNTFSCFKQTLEEQTLEEQGLDVAYRSGQGLCCSG